MNYIILNQFFLKSNYSLVIFKNLKNLKKKEVYLKSFEDLYFINSDLKLIKEINNYIIKQYKTKTLKKFIFKTKILFFKFDKFLIYYQIIKKLNKKN